MCGRFTITTPQKIEKRFKTSNKLPLFRPSWNIAPSQYIPTITRNSPNKIIMMNWGLYFSPNVKFGTINLRGESFKDKPFFKHFLENKRCLIVADSFYEWGEVNLEGKPEKYPFNFFLKDRKLFGFAGIYNDLEDSKGIKTYTCAIITTKPNEKVKKIHQRMPVILEEKDEEMWLNPDNKDFNELFKLLKPYSASKMSMQVVSRLVNNPRIDDPRLIEKYEPRKKGYGLLD
jgi:putative SOS response-associated peptidase YedK